MDPTFHLVDDLRVESWIANHELEGTPRKAHLLLES